LAILQAVFAMCQVGISHTNTNKVRGFVYMSLANVISGLVNHFIYIRFFLHAYNIDSCLDLA